MKNRRLTSLISRSERKIWKF